MTRRGLPSIVREHLRRSRKLEGGTVVQVEVRHDDDCPYFDGKPCLCDVELESGARVDRMYS